MVVEIRVEIGGAKSPSWPVYIDPCRAGRLSSRKLLGLT